MVNLIAAPPAPAPRRSRGGWLAAGVVLTVLAVLAGVVAILAPLFVRTETTTSVHDGAPAHLIIDVDDLHDLDITPGEPGRVTLERTTTWAVGAPEISEKWAGDTLRIRVRCRVDLGPCEVGYALSVPPATDLTVRADSTSLEVADLTGDLDLSAAVGDVLLNRVSGTVRTSVGTGRVELVASSSAEVTASITVGDLALHFAAPPTRVTAKVGTGRAQLQVPREAYLVDAHTGIGARNTQVTDTPGATRSITVEAEVGDLAIDYAL